ncbi:hypothetical protein [Rhizobium sp. Leaf341]|uniref:hypothetical protein n=1 Tax=Rhizobium sp. Leaf341 TaxID=1736344 RepID=UPI0007137C64|nr:hypothetical protein [Rhizobium sp. Leaf341]KQR77869.1 hypothetical protein ASG03_16020 [Rhizobium sp. Leaf341]
MSGLETAIKQALERSDRANAETRARIYQSARNALEAGLRKQNVQDETVIAQQRHRLEVAIHAIEQQERATLRDAAVVQAPDPMQVPNSGMAPVLQEPVRAELPVGSREHRREEPGFDDVVPDRAAAEFRPPSIAKSRRSESAVVEPEERRDSREDASLAPMMVSPDRDPFRPGAHARDTVNDLGLPGAEPLVPRRRRGRGGRIASILMVVAVLVAAVGSATWWVLSTGLLERPEGQPGPPPTVAAEDFDGGAGLRTLGAQAGFTADWVDLYLPTAPSGVTPGARVRTDVVRDEGGARLRITSGASDGSGNVAIEVPASALQRMAGQTSTLALSVQSADGKPTQFSVECDFASLGDCGRHRFTVNDEKSDMLFKITFDRTLSPNGPGRLLINSDVTANGGGLDLYAIRLLPGQ